MIDISKFNKADVLAALYNSARAQGLGNLWHIPADMTREQAEHILTLSLSFDYLQGRVMKVDLSGDSFDPFLYDRDNGEGAAQAALSKL
ncbi:hypothetical protein M0R72_00425 [Candidatus Pacearchaeota archaeon]|jgi:hypothetical protein|nr:hypothetical protein [Candidatus Pacearchaeota archaeon]